LIFFMVVMKFKQVEETQAADLPTDSGFAKPTDAPQELIITLRLKWQNDIMVYDVCVDQQANGKAVNAGTLGDLMQGRDARSGYRDIFQKLVATLHQVNTSMGGLAKKIEVSYNEPTTNISSSLHPEKTAPWGFVTLAIDACTQFNKDIFQQTGDEDKKLGVVFKNTAASGVQKLAGE